MRKLIALGAMTMFCLLVGYIVVSDSLTKHEQKVLVEEAFLQKRLCAMKSTRARAEFCSKYERKLGEASVGCYDFVDEGRTMIRTYVYWSDYSPGPDRPLDCSN